MPWLTPSRRKWLFLAVKLVIVAVVLWFLRSAVVEAAARLRDHASHGARPLQWSPAWLALSGLLYLAGLLPEGIFWHRVLRALGQEAGLGETLRAYFIGHLGKYVPGKAMVVVLRAGLIRSRRVDTGLAVASVFLATLTMMSVGAFLAAAILAAVQPEDPNERAFLGLAVVAVALTGLPTLPPVFARLARWAGVGRSSPAIAERLAGLRYGLLAGGWMAMILGWLLMGASLWAVLGAMGLSPEFWVQWHPASAVLALATVALAVVGGFVSMIPGGLVAREAVVTVFLGHELGDPALALIAAALLRLVWLVAEVLISGILYVCGPRTQPEIAEP